MPGDESWPAFLARVSKIEREWLGQGPGYGTSQFLPWMPLALPRFVMYLTDAMSVTPGDSFLEVGCGPGSKLLLAEALFGLEAVGIERVPEYVDAALANGAYAAVADAFDYPAYDEADIVYLNKPCHGQLEIKLERLIMAAMKQGAVLMMANAALRPDMDEWELVAAEWDTNSGVWRKG